MYDKRIREIDAARENECQMMPNTQHRRQNQNMPLFIKTGMAILLSSLDRFACLSVEWSGSFMYDVQYNSSNSGTALRRIDRSTCTCSESTLGFTLFTSSLLYLFFLQPTD